MVRVAVSGCLRPVGEVCGAPITFVNRRAEPIGKRRPVRQRQNVRRHATSAYLARRRLTSHSEEN